MHNPHEAALDTQDCQIALKWMQKEGMKVRNSDKYLEKAMSRVQQHEVLDLLMPRFGGSKQGKKEKRGGETTVIVP
jgi:hypothetical protein